MDEELKQLLHDGVNTTSCIVGFTDLLMSEQDSKEKKKFAKGLTDAAFRLADIMKRIRIICDEGILG